MSYQWLIELTGPPKRTVNFGVNPLTGKQPRFDWSSFAFPACSSCNEKYSDLEGAVKPIVERLLGRIPITGYEFVKLLDWLDKVRIGLWLAIDTFTETQLTFLLISILSLG
jgi:hypothetical protein